MRFLLFFVVFNSSLANLFSQKNPVVILGTAIVDNESSIDVTEVTIQEYTYFIINNNFDSTLFPNLLKLSPPARAYFQDLKKGERSLFITIGKNHSIMASSFGDKGFIVTKVYRNFEKNDSTGFTIFNPVVAVSFEQAQRFCEWRQNNENRSRTVKLRIMLPPRNVYQRLIKNTDSLLTQRNTCDAFQFNFAHPPCIANYKNKDMRQQGVGLVRTDRFKPTQKLYNIQGNVAEMTSIKGIATGGSFKHSAKESMRDEVQYYTAEEEWLGFRCYVVLQENYFRKARD